MRACFQKLVFAALLGLTSNMAPLTLSAQQVPRQLQPPPNEHVLLQVHAKGDQVYSCAADGSQYLWTLKAPDAQLFTLGGKPFGRHFAGPSWQATDGSQVTGKASANAPSPHADSIPWLLVTVVSRSGDGVLAHVSSIQRLNTSGGKSPPAGCDSAHVGRELRIPYSADYVFFVAD